MHRCRPLVFLTACGSWALLAAWGVGTTGASDISPVSTRSGRVAPVWRPVRPSKSLETPASPTPTRGQAAPQQPPDDAADRLAQVRPAASNAPVAEEAPAQGPVLIFPGGAAHPAPVVHEGPVIDPGASSLDGNAVEYFDPALSESPALGGLAYDGGLWQPERNLILFAGVHGFKGPTDLGLGGNFGFHEGVNWGAPLGDPWGYGYQVGFQALHSNFAGSQTVTTGPLTNFDPADRNQVFLTAGLFKRPPGDGWQTGVVFDLFYDNYYHRSTLYQIRSDTALVFGDLHELGYWGAYGVSQDTVSGLGQFDTVLHPTDLFAVFYRRRFTGGGRGRLWAGLSGNGDVIFGLDGTVPLGTNWALDNNFTCLFPKHGRSAGGPPEESWSVSIHLVWYPGRSAGPILSSPFYPLFYVADNSWFLIDRR